MKLTTRFTEYKTLAYRILLAYLFYFISRVLFVLFNSTLLDISSFSEFMSLAYYGLTFDTTAILYVNFLFIVLSLIPLFNISTQKSYQKALFYIYFSFNLIAYLPNITDLIYYKFIYSRTTVAAWDSLKDEGNIIGMFIRFSLTYWYIPLIFFSLSYLWIFLYKKIKLKPTKVDYYKTSDKVKHIAYSVIYLAIIVVCMIAAIRGGDLKKSTRPINMLDASRHIKKPQHSDVVLNTTFAIIRTFNVNSFQKIHVIDNPDIVKQNFNPIKQYSNNTKSTPNVVLFILESFGKEYVGAFNQNNDIPNYKGYTPFLDSLSKHSLMFTNGFANGSKSIHGMSSVISGIPSFKEAFTSSPFSNQRIQSISSCLEDMGYETSFFHGAPNGSMGFLGFSNILGINHYYGKTEFNDDTEFDGSWGIWDDPFLQFMEKTLNTQKQPFFSTVFTVTSHEPYVIPEKYKDAFPKGDIPIHKGIGYTDFALKNFFEAAKKEEWFNNTIFIFTADHCNQPFYKKYTEMVNKLSVPIMIYTPDERLKGVNTELAQQIDIYPTVLDLVGYDKPFMSWGRSLVGDTLVKPYAINYSNNLYQFQRGNYITIFDGKNVIGYYDINDKALQNNLISQPNKEMLENGEACKALIQDYFDRIVDRKLHF